MIVVRKHQFGADEREAWLGELAAVINERSRQEKVRYARRAEPWVL